MDDFGGLLALVAGIASPRPGHPRVTSPIAAVIETFRSLANGDYTRNVDIARNDEMGKGIAGLQSMQIQQGFQCGGSGARIGEENLRIKIGLDCVATSSLCALPISTGASSTQQGPADEVGEMEDLLRTYIPGFSADAGW